MLLNSETGRARPIVFLCLQTIEALQQIGLTNPGDASRGAQPLPNLRDEAIEGLRALCERTGALIVGTSPPPPPSQDARDYLLARGLVAPCGPEWVSCSVATDRHGQILAWLKRNGAPLCVVIDRPGVGPDSAIRISVRDGHTLTMDACARASEMLRAKLEAADV